VTLTLDEARLQVRLEIQRTHGSPTGPEEWVLLDDYIERPWGWAFFYNTRGALGGDDRYLVAGNGPILINRATGSMHFCGSAFPVEHYLEEYEAQLAAYNSGNA
jgi:hypothetical protein